MSSSRAARTQTSGRTSRTTGLDDGHEPRQRRLRRVLILTWQVDRKCHMISASSFDKMCADMKTQADDMSDDLYAHGARELVSKELSSPQVEV